jgi:hypothetical protein
VAKHFINSNKIGINSNAEDFAPLYVNGTIHQGTGEGGASTLGKIDLPVYYRSSGLTYLDFDLGDLSGSRMITIEIKGNGYG